MSTLSINITTNYTNKINFQWFIFYKFIVATLFQNLKISSHQHFLILKLLTNSNKNPNSNKSSFVKPIFSRNTQSKFYYKQKTHFNNTTVSKHSFVTSSNYSLFLLYVQQTTNHSSSFLQPHAYFKAFFLTTTLNSSPVLNISKLYLKWINTYNLLINLFFFKTSLLLFSNKTLKNETLGFNWSQNLLSYKLFKYTSPIFFLKDSKYGVTPTLIFKRFEQKSLSTAFLTDVKYHEKNLYYLKRFHIYTIGLVPYNLNPWMVSYSIPTSINSVFIQFFFIQFLSLLSQSNETRTFNKCKNLWSSKA